MATIAEQLTSLANTKTAIKDAIVAKGVTVADTDPFSAYPAKIGEIQGGGGAPATKFGASVDTWIGDVDENGVLRKTTWTGALNFAGVKEIGFEGLHYAFYNSQNITSVDLGSLQSVGEYGMYYAFNKCDGITSVDLSSLTSVEYNGLRYAFYYCSNITSVDLSSLTSVGDNGLHNAFAQCSNITSVDLSSLTSVGDNGLQHAFGYCSKLIIISFPLLTDVLSNSFGTSTATSIFNKCTALTEIHFRADMQATIEAMSQYANKWGATNATIYFDL